MILSCIYYTLNNKEKQVIPPYGAFIRMQTGLTLKTDCFSVFKSLSCIHS